MAYPSIRSQNPDKIKYRKRTVKFFKDCKSVISLPCLA